MTVARSGKPGPNKGSIADQLARAMEEFAESEMQVNLDPCFRARDRAVKGKVVTRFRRAGLDSGPTNGYKSSGRDDVSPARSAPEGASSSHQESFMNQANQANEADANNAQTQADKEIHKKAEKVGGWIGNNRGKLGVVAGMLIGALGLAGVNTLRDRKSSQQNHTTAGNQM